MGTCAGQSGKQKHFKNIEAFQRQNSQHQSREQQDQQFKGEFIQNEQVEQIIPISNNLKLEVGIIPQNRQEEVQTQNEKQEIEQIGNDQFDVDAKMGEAVEQIEINLIPKQDVIQIQEGKQILPVVVQIKTKRDLLQQKKRQANIDIVCVVDVSGSMEGEKLQQVKDSLRYVQKILGPDDRMAIVTFHAYAKIELGWTVNSAENKQKIKDIIVRLTDGLTTNIAAGLELGLFMIQKREEKNPVSCLFLLTDGQDDQPDVSQRCKEMIMKYDLKETLVMHTFGYGQDHDAVAMNDIANLAGGHFIYIDKIEKAAQHFILSLSGMLSIFAGNIELSLEEVNPCCQIRKIFGDFQWKPNINPKLKQRQKETYQTNIIYLLEKDEREFVIELEIQADQQINLKQEVVLKASLSGTVIKFHTTFSKSTELKIQYQSEPGEFQLKEIVEVNHLKARAGEKIGEAKDLANNEKYDQAQQILKKTIIEIEKSQFKETKALQNLRDDLEQVRDLCKPQVYEVEGELIMLKKQRNHLQQECSLNNSVDWNSMQMENIDNYNNGNLNLTQVMSDRNSRPLSLNSSRILEAENKQLGSLSSSLIDNESAIMKKSNNKSLEFGEEKLSDIESPQFYK